MHLLVLGTHNRKKGQELAQLLAPFGFELKTLADFPSPLNVEETGETFAENAACDACGCPVVIAHAAWRKDDAASGDLLHALFPKRLNVATAANVHLPLSC